MGKDEVNWIVMNATKAKIIILLETTLNYISIYIFIFSLWSLGKCFNIITVLFLKEFPVRAIAIMHNSKKIINFF